MGVHGKVLSMTQILIAGGGIGGLAAALACRKAGADVQLVEQAASFGEVGAGLQLGPNAVRVLDLWGLGKALRDVAAFPQRLQVRDAADGRLLGAMRLGVDFKNRYGTDYLTLHRADLHQVLLTAVQASGVDLHLQTTVATVAAVNAIKSRAISEALISANCHKEGENTANTFTCEAHALIACDGLWSRVRQQLLQDGRPLPTGHVAYRAMLAAADVPAGLATDQVTVWLGPQMHAVAYPVRGGALFNVVAIVHDAMGSPASIRAKEGDQDPENWNQSAHAEILLQRLSGLHKQLLNLISSASSWTRWVLHDRDPLLGPHQMAQGRIALLGDAAHPMRPYLAQGAAMALEDAQTLGHVLRLQPDIPTALRAYAIARWARNARVQAQSRRNGRIFHATGPLRIARNLAMATLGESLMDTPWLYAGQPTAQ